MKIFFIIFQCTAALFEIWTIYVLLHWSKWKISELDNLFDTSQHLPNLITIDHVLATVRQKLTNPCKCLSNLTNTNLMTLMILSSIFQALEAVQHFFGCNFIIRERILMNLSRLFTHFPNKTFIHTCSLKWWGEWRERTWKMTWY